MTISQIRTLSEVTAERRNFSQRQAQRRSTFTNIICVTAFILAVIGSGFCN